MTAPDSDPPTCFGCRRLEQRQVGHSLLYWCRHFDPANSPARGAMRDGAGHPPQRHNETCWESETWTTTNITPRRR